MTGNNALQNTISSQKEYNHDIKHICPACWVYLSTSHLYSQSWDWSKLVTHRSAAVAQITALDRSSDNPNIETATTHNPTIILWVGASPPPPPPTILPLHKTPVRVLSGSQNSAWEQSLLKTFVLLNSVKENIWQPLVSTWNETFGPVTMSRHGNVVIAMASTFLAQPNLTYKYEIFVIIVVD